MISSWTINIRFRFKFIALAFASYSYSYSHSHSQTHSNSHLPLAKLDEAQCLPHLLSHPCATLPQQQQQQRQQQMLSAAIICAALATPLYQLDYGRAQIAFEVESQHLGDSKWRLRVQRGRQTVSPTGYCPACPSQSVSVPVPFLPPLLTLSLSVAQPQVLRAYKMAFIERSEQSEKRGERGKRENVRQCRKSYQSFHFTAIIRVRRSEFKCRRKSN